jgi:hypothetical protein
MAVFNQKQPKKFRKSLILIEIQIIIVKLGWTAVNRVQPRCWAVILTKNQPALFKNPFVSIWKLYLNVFFGLIAVNQTVVDAVTRGYPLYQHQNPHYLSLFNGRGGRDFECSNFRVVADKEFPEASESSGSSRDFPTLFSSNFTKSPCFFNWSNVF